MKDFTDVEIVPHHHYSISEARNLCPRRPCIRTIWRWIDKGVSRGGDRRRLKITRVGGRTYVKGVDLLAFLQQPQQTSADRTAEFLRANAAAQKYLEELGV